MGLRATAKTLQSPRWSKGFLSILAMTTLLSSMLTFGCGRYERHKAYSNDSPNQALYYAIKAGDISRSRALLDKGVDVNTRFSGEGWTPLIVALWYGKEDIATDLLNRGADVDASVKNGVITPLRVAEKRGYVEIADYIRKNRNIRLKDAE